MAKSKMIVTALVLLAALGMGAYKLWRMREAAQTNVAAASGYAQSEWPAAYKLVRDKFPDVPSLSPAALAAWLNDTQKVRPVLLDARELKEYRVSHLPGAEFAVSEIQALELLKTKAADAPIVVYCSIGYRSAALAQKLKARGFTNVQNLEGSIFMWANEGRPLERDRQPVSGVHPFDEKWGRLLARERWTWE